MKTIVFGAGNAGKQYANNCDKDIEIIAFADNNLKPLSRGGVTLCGHPRISPSEIPNYAFDKIVIAIDDYTLRGPKDVESIILQLKGYGIDNSKIALQYEVNNPPNSPRILFLKIFAQNFKQSQDTYAVAECGVFRGHYSAYINLFFPERKLYLFDTFEGFDERDMKKENQTYNHAFSNQTEIDVLKSGSIDAVKMRCPYPENLIFKKGYIPDTFAGLENEKFVFVHLDVDLYAVHLAALDFFLPKMAPNGLIVLHDYFEEKWSGVKKAVDEISDKYNFIRIHVGDGSSIALFLKSDF